LSDQFYDMLGRHFPNQFMFYFTIFMGNYVTLGDNTAPGDLRMACLKVKGNPICSFADNFQMAFYCASQHAIILIVMKCLPGDKFPDCLSGIPHVP